MNAIETNLHFLATVIGRRTASAGALSAIDRWLRNAAHILAAAPARRVARMAEARRERAVRRYCRNRELLGSSCFRFDARRDDVLARAGA